jgi:cyclohexa-1,5-dienecarbonyl-CoA hydratase
MPEPVSVAFEAAQRRARFTLFNPKGNIITRQTIAALRAALEAMSENPHLKLITIEGAGDDFSFGASIPEHAPGEIELALPEMDAMLLELLDAPAPTAALVRGRCLGGGFELALACDFIFAEEGASFALPEIALGVFPPVASAVLPYKVGSAPASAAILTGQVRDARDWHARGLVAMIAGRGALQSSVDEWYEAHLAPKSAAALRHAAAASRMALATHVRELLPKLERLYLDDLMRTQDAAEGIGAFLAKRAPSWTDR